MAGQINIWITDPNTRTKKLGPENGWPFLYIELESIKEICIQVLSKKLADDTESCFCADNLTIYNIFKIIWLRFISLWLPYVRGLNRGFKNNKQSNKCTKDRHTNHCIHSLLTTVSGESFICTWVPLFCYTITYHRQYLFHSGIQ